LAYRRDLRTGYAVLQRITDRRAVFETDHAGAQIGKIDLEQTDQFAAQTFAFGIAVREQDKLGEAGLRQLLIEWQIEARRARAHVTDIVLELRTLDQPGFEFLHLGFGGEQGRAFAELEITQQFGPRRFRKKLLLHETEAEY